MTGSLASTHGVAQPRAPLIHATWSGATPPRLTHALVDGNTRLGWLATVVFHGLNDMTLEAPDDGTYELVMAVARSEPTVETVAAALGSWH